MKRNTWQTKELDFDAQTWEELPTYEEDASVDLTVDPDWVILTQPGDIHRPIGEFNT